MSARLTFVFAAVLFAVVCMTNATLAKPPDLPIDANDDCATRVPQAACVEALGPISGPAPTIHEDTDSAVFQHFVYGCSMRPGLILGVRKCGHCLCYGLHPISSVMR